MNNNKKTMHIGMLAVFAFSFCVVLMCEYIQKQRVTALADFTIENLGIVLFCTVLVFLLTMAMTCLFRSAFAGAAVTGILLYILSCVEFYKYSISGSHLVAADLTFALNIGDIASFGNIHPQAHLVRALAALVLLLLCMSRVRLRLPKLASRGIAMSVICAAFMVIFVSPNAAVDGTYKLCDFDTVPALTSMSLNDRFENDGFLGFLSQSATEMIGTALTVPDGYSEKYMKELASPPAEAATPHRPNVVIIASESWSDLRELSPEVVGNGAYAAFDRAAALGTVRKCVLPTFGGYTVRTEFELLFGLPSLSMGNVPAPHSLLLRDKPQNTVVSEYDGLGYRTVYMHAFSGDFYNRNEVYSQYGFDKLLFADAFDAEHDKFRRYISDAAMMKKIKDELIGNDAASFIFAMTMQNHQPYVAENGARQDELSYYLEGIKKTSEALYELIVWLQNFDEDTIVLFVGDHLPFFTPQGGVYDRLGVDGSISEKLYTQKYLMYSNFGTPQCADTLVSSFYLPHILMREAGLELGSFPATMLDEMKQMPVYSIARGAEQECERLDSVTYDRTIGGGYLK